MKAQVSNLLMPILTIRITMMTQLILRRVIQQQVGENLLIQMVLARNLTAIDRVRTDCMGTEVNPNRCVLVAGCCTIAKLLVTIRPPQQQADDGLGLLPPPVLPDSPFFEN